MPRCPCPTCLKLINTARASEQLPPQEPAAWQSPAQPNPRSLCREAVAKRRARNKAARESRRRNRR